MASVGFLRLDTCFPRVLGDAGCAQTWDFPVLYETVAGGTPEVVVRRGGADLLPDFIAGGRRLCERGASGISTTCGFLVLWQAELAAALPVPVLSSPLLLAGDIPLAAGERLGILSASGADLSAAHLAAAGICAEKTVVGGLPPTSAFAKTLLENLPTLDTADAEKTMREAARDLCAAAAADGGGDVGAILLECANMPPYAEAVRAETGLRVFSVVDAVNGFWRRIVADGRTG